MKIWFIFLIYVFFIDYKLFFNIYLLTKPSNQVLSVSERDKSIEKSFKSLLSLQISHYDRRIKELESDLREAHEQTKKAHEEVINIFYKIYKKHVIYFIV